jgi:phosphatidylglycerophosphate synthase
MDRAQSQRTIRIDARPMGPNGLLATHLVLGRPMLQHAIEVAERAAPGVRIILHADAKSVPALAHLVPEPTRSRVSIWISPPEGDSPAIRTDFLYDAKRLKKAIDKAQPFDRAILWRLDTPQGIVGADAELTRRTSYQPLGRYWALEPARRLARLLAPTTIRPNAVTLLAFVFMAAASYSVAMNAPRPIVALALAIGLVLDTADGHLARLQGTASDFGRWLDGLLDELADHGLHIAIGWSAFMRDSNPAWLVLVAVYIAAKSIFVQSSSEWDRIRDRGRDIAAEGARPQAAGWPTRIVRTLAHADLRWHIWILLALIGRLEFGLVFYGLYFPVRLIAGLVPKWRASSRVLP